MGLIESQDRLADSLIEAIGPIGEALAAESEIVLHDLRKLPNSIVAVAGDVTGRKVGDTATSNWHPVDSATEALLETFAEGRGRDLIGYLIQTDDGRLVQSRTTLIRDHSGEPLLVLCVNTALPVDAGRTPTEAAATLADRLRDVDDTDLPVGSLRELADVMIARAVEKQGVPVSKMKKRHKLEVVRHLRSAGVFHMRDGIDLAASSLEVSKFTIYNYLNEISGSEEASSA